MFTVKADTKQLDNLITKLSRLEKDLVKGKSLWRSFAIKLHKHESLIFNSETGYNGSEIVPWPHYYQTFANKNDADKYISWKEKKKRGSGLTLLQLTGKLKNSLKPLVLTDSTMVFGTRVKYAQYHNTIEGFPPAYRPFLHPNPLMMAELLKESEKFAKSTTRKWFK